MKPGWSIALRLALDMERNAERLRTLALEELRCPETESGGVRCTADRNIPHAHRINEEDLP